MLLPGGEASCPDRPNTLRYHGWFQCVAILISLTARVQKS